MTFKQWQQTYPEAASALTAVLNGTARPADAELVGKSEAWAQQKSRFQIAGQGALAWRNNVGATPAKCPDCGTPRQPIRYGLANDSRNLNSALKSSDLILAIPRKITPPMVGQTIAQFGSIESKRPGWKYTGKAGEPEQAAWLALINSVGGFASFSTGVVEL